VLLCGIAAAVSYGPRVIGIVLSGLLDDGVAGLWWVKKFGGIAVVQEPRETMYPAMPAAALEHVDVDHVVGMAEMGPLLERLVQGEPVADVKKERS